MNPNSKTMFPSCSTESSTVYAEDRANSKHDRPVEELRFKQIIDSQEHGLLGITDDGTIYEYHPFDEAWFRFSMRLA